MNQHTGLQGESRALLTTKLALFAGLESSPLIAMKPANRLAVDYHRLRLIEAAVLQTAIEHRAWTLVNRNEDPHSSDFYQTTDCNLSNRHTSSTERSSGYSSNASHRSLCQMKTCKLKKRARTPLVKAA